MLNNFERETHLIFNETESTALVQTFNGAMKRKLEKLAAERPEECRLLKQYSEGEVRYCIPKRWVKVNASRILTEEEKRERTAIMLKNRR